MYLWIVIKIIANIGLLIIKVLVDDESCKQIERNKLPSI